VTFALDLDLEHTLDAGLPDDYRVQVWWRSVHLRARTSDLRESLQTDGRTDDGRLAIVLAHSWNELQMEVDKLVMLLMFGFFRALSPRSVGRSTPNFDTRSAMTRIYKIGPEILEPLVRLPIYKLQ